MRRRELEADDPEEDLTDPAPEPAEESDDDGGFPCDGCGARIGPGVWWRVVCDLCAPGIPDQYELDPGDSHDSKCHGRPECGRTGLSMNETRAVCEDCYRRIVLGPAPGATALPSRERADRGLTPRELKRRTGRHRCVELCGRLREGRSPRCRECGRVHRRELARQRQLKRRTRGRAALHRTGQASGTVTQSTGRAPARLRSGDGGGGVKMRDTEGAAIGSRVFRTEAPTQVSG